MAARNEASARRWALVLCVGLLAAAGCRQILGVEDPVPCESSAECALEGEPCVAGECIDGACTYSKIAAGSPAATDVPGDCSRSVCDDSGKATTEVDPDDAPADDAAGDCQVPACGSDGSITTAPAETDVAEDVNPGDCKAPGCDADGDVIDVDSPDDCNCPVGEMVPCYDGPAGTQNEGPCLGGMADCETGGVLGVCIGQVLPGPDSCLTDAADEDCSGDNNECTGDHLWSWGFGGQTLEYPATSITLPIVEGTLASSIVVVNWDTGVSIGGEQLTGPGRNAAIVKIDEAGMPSVLAEYAVHVSATGRRNDVVFLGGTLQDEQTESFGGGVPFTPLGDDGFVAAFDTEMNVDWVQVISSTASDRVFGIHPRPGGGVVAYGIVYGTTSFELGGMQYPLVGFTGANYFVAAYDSAGALSWVTRWISGLPVDGNDALRSVAVAPMSGDVFVCGYSEADLSVTDKDGGSVLLHDNLTTSTDAWVFRLNNSDGKTSASNIVKMVSPGADTCDSVATLADNGRVIAGTVSGDVAYGSGVTIDQIGSAGIPDGFLLKVSPNGTPQEAITLDMSSGGINVGQVDVGADGSIAAVGAFTNGTLAIAGDSYTAPSGRSDGYVVKFGPSLLQPPHWKKHLFKIGVNVGAYTVHLGQDFGIVVGGQMDGGFQAGGAQLDFVNMVDVFYAKYAQ